MSGALSARQVELVKRTDLIASRTGFPGKNHIISVISGFICISVFTCLFFSPAWTFETPGPIFAFPGRVITLEHEPGEDYSKALLRSRRRGEEFVVDCRSGDGQLVLELTADLPSDYFDIVLIPDNRKSPRLFMAGALKILRKTLNSIRIVHITDIHYGEDETKSNFLADTIETINLIDPEFVLCSGDMMTDPEPEGLAELKKIMDGLKSPVFYSPGNHDHRDIVIFHRYFSPMSYYSFDAGDLHFISLDTGASADLFSRTGEGINGDQLRWLKNDLEHSKGKNTYIWLHHSPVLKSDSFRDGRTEFLRLVSHYKVKGIMAGHLHRDGVFTVEENGREIFSFSEGGPVVIHTTTLSSKRLKGDDYGFRLLELSSEGVSPVSPFKSISKDSVIMQCREKPEDNKKCVLENKTGTVIPGVRVNSAYFDLQPGRTIFP